MDITNVNLTEYFENLPSEPPMSLRGGNARDEYRAVPGYDPEIDLISPDYLETYFWGISHLDVSSWRFYLPHLLEYAIQNRSNPDSNALEALLLSLRPPDREPPRFGSLSALEEEVVVSVLDKLAFSDDSAWQAQAMLALEEFWAPGALYR